MITFQRIWELVPTGDVNLKRLALVLLTLQNVSTVLLSRYVRSRSGDMFISSTAVAMSELVKLFVCLFLVLLEEKMVFKNFLKNLYENLFKDHWDNLLIGVPGVAYAFQNNLLFLAVSNLNASVFQVSYQLKVFTTAIFFRIILRRILTAKHYAMLTLLFIGVILAQADHIFPKASGKIHTEVDEKARTENSLFGILCICLACILSGFSGVFFELVLKSTNKTIVIRNIQLSVYGIIASIVSVFMQDHKLVLNKGFFYGYDHMVWLAIFVQSLGGLLVAAVVRYADNILKNFATSVAIVLTLICSVLLFNHQPTIYLIIGNICVITSTILYSMLPPPILESTPTFLKVVTPIHPA